MFLEIYNSLLSSYGPQGWWPVTPIGCREKEYRPIHGIKATSDKQRFEIMIGAILTQNTAWKNVEKAIENLNIADILDIDKIIKIDPAKLGKLIRPSGYYNQKAKRLKIIAQFIKDNPINKLNKLDTQTLRKKLLELKGIGPETADCILLYVFKRLIFVIDAYTKRIMQRIGIGFKDYDDLQNIFMTNLENDEKIFNEYHALLVEHAKRYCRKKALCEGCIIKKECKKLAV